MSFGSDQSLTWKSMACDLKVWHIHHPPFSPYYFMSHTKNPARLIINLDALAHNYRYFQSLHPQGSVWPVVKANAYGLGSDPIAKRLMHEGANSFFVARLSEGQSLRMAIGARPEIFVLDGYNDASSSFWKSHRLSPVINDLAQLRAWRQDHPKSAYGLHIDTGMNRLGLRANEFMIGDLNDDKNLRFIMSHLACADEPNHALNQSQYNHFTKAIEGYNGLVSLAASAGALLGADYQFSFTRPGIGLYGGGPKGFTYHHLQPVATLYALILALRDIGVGETIGYGARFCAEKPMKLATIGLGYADGFHRRFGQDGHLVFNDQRLKVVGRVSMDLITIDVTDCDIKVGQEVEIFGPNRLIDEMAADGGTICYEILTSLSPRIERQWIGLTHGKS